MSVHIRNVRGKLYLDIYSNGRRKWESLGLRLEGDAKQDAETWRLAKLARSIREQQLFSKEWNLLDPIAGKKKFEDYCKEIAKTMPTKSHLAKALPYIRDYAHGVRLEAIDEQWLAGFKSYLLSQSTIKQVTAAHYYAAACHVLKLAYQSRLITRNPAANVKKIQEPESVKVWLTEEELEKLARTPLGGELGDTIRCAFLFGCMTGLRISDLKSLRWGDITRSPSLMIMKRQQKTQTVVGVPINESAWQIIDDKKLHDGTELVFPKLSSSKTSATQYFRMWTAKAGIPKKIGWHTARHTFATLALEGGANLYTVQRMLGHVNISTTEVYAKATDKLKREAVEGLPTLELDKRAELKQFRKAK